MYAFALICIMAGLLFNYFNIGNSNFQIYGSVGNWLVNIGFVGLIIATVRLLARKKQNKGDERMEFVATKALRITFLFLIIGAFILIIFDGIKTITLPYHLFMSYLICVLLIIYFVTYKLLLRYN
jgi:O-antigen/teichoic acid export membrane protein